MTIVKQDDKVGLGTLSRKFGVGGERYRHEIQWVVPAHSASGYIVQRIQRHEKHDRFVGSKTVSQDHYWEVWEIHNGVVFPFKFNNLVHDRFGPVGQARSSGQLEVTVAMKKKGIHKPFTVKNISHADTVGRFKIRGTVYCLEPTNDATQWYEQRDADPHSAGAGYLKTSTSPPPALGSASLIRNEAGEWDLRKNRDHFCRNRPWPIKSQFGIRPLGKDDDPIKLK